MLSFHNDPKIKEKYLARVKDHRENDNLIQGLGWKNGRGCAVGCTLQNYDHSRYPIELGLPEWLARLQDNIFEKLEKTEAMEWPEKFLEAIAVGVDVEIVRHKIAVKRMDRLLVIQNKLLENNSDKIKKIILQSISAINLVKKCHESEINENFCDLSKALSAVMSIESAARSEAWSASWSASWSAAESAARSVESAAWPETWLAVMSEEFKKEADCLLEELRELK